MGESPSWSITCLKTLFVFHDTTYGQGHTARRDDMEGLHRLQFGVLSRSSRAALAAHCIGADLPARDDRL